LGQKLDLPINGPNPTGFLPIILILFLTDVP
jgi:hypothetical protein